MVEKSDDRLLPQSKIRTIMKSCGDPNNLLSKESILVVTKAAELFISYLAHQTYTKNGSKNEITYNDLSRFVQNEEKLEFLHQMVPKKITVKEFRDILAQETDSDSNSSDSDEDSTESEDEDEEEEGEEEEDEEDGVAEEQDGEETESGKEE